MRRQTLDHEQEVEVTLASRGRVLNRLQAEINQRLKAIQEMEQEAAALERLIASLQPRQGSFTDRRPVNWSVDRYCISLLLWG